MKVWDITLSCDHKLLVIAPTPGAALACAAVEAKPHNAKPEGQPVEVDLTKAGLLVWYPGPWSLDAIRDPDPEEVPS